MTPISWRKTDYFFRVFEIQKMLQSTHSWTNTALWKKLTFIVNDNALNFQ